MMLRALMMEHCRYRCKKGEIICLKGQLPEPGRLKASLLKATGEQAGSSEGPAHESTNVPVPSQMFLVPDPEARDFDMNPSAASAQDDGLQVLVEHMEPCVFVEARA